MNKLYIPSKELCLGNSEQLISNKHLLAAIQYYSKTDN